MHASVVLVQIRAGELMGINVVLGSWKIIEENWARFDVNPI
jgi:hypothetical protein